VICFFASGFGIAACPAFIANWFPRKKGIALGWATMGAPISSSAFVAGFSVLLATKGIHTAFMIFGIFAVIIGIITFFWAKMSRLMSISCRITWRWMRISQHRKFM
jgi:MFS family permease